MAGKLRLINVHTLELETDFKVIPNYAILSHRWQDSEVDFQQMQDETLRSGLNRFAKIQSFCRQVERHKYHYAWVDTCCIKKQSDAELTEAINSMFSWYRMSRQCYLYLHDVVRDPALAIDEYECRKRGNPEGTMSEVFTRGWTLQELLAPETVVIYDRDWNILGTKHTLAPTLANITGIDEAVLRGFPMSKRSIAQRMA